jgi:hypothetical protein
MATTLEIHFLTLKYTHCQFCQNYPKKVAKIKLILAKLAFATDYEAWVIMTILKVQKHGSQKFRDPILVCTHGSQKISKNQITGPIKNLQSTAGSFMKTWSRFF